MKWTIKYRSGAIKKAKKIDPTARKRIRNFLEGRLANLDDPRSIGTALVSQKEEIIRYRVGDFRVLCNIMDNEITILVIDLDHRSKIYRSH